MSKQLVIGTGGTFADDSVSIPGMTDTQRIEYLEDFALMIGRADPSTHSDWAVRGEFLNTQPGPTRISLKAGSIRELVDKAINS